MLTKYLDAAMRHAHYRCSRTMAASTAKSPPAGAYTPTQLLWRRAGKNLPGSSRDWLRLRIHKNLALPTIDGLELKVEEEFVA